MNRKLNKIDTRVEHLQEHVNRAQRAVERLNSLAWTVDDLLEVADEYNLKPKTYAWEREGFLLDLHFEDEIPSGVLETVRDNFDEVSIHYGGGHAACKSGYDYFVRASVQVEYGP